MPLGEFKHPLYIDHHQGMIDHAKERTPYGNYVKWAHAARPHLRELTPAPVLWNDLLLAVSWQDDRGRVAAVRICRWAEVVYLAKWIRCECAWCHHQIVEQNTHSIPAFDSMAQEGWLCRSLREIGDYHPTAHPEHGQLEPLPVMWGLHLIAVSWHKAAAKSTVVQVDILQPRYLLRLREEH